MRLRKLTTRLLKGSSRQKYSSCIFCLILIRREFFNTLNIISARSSCPSLCFDPNNSSTFFLTLPRCLMLTPFLVLCCCWKLERGEGREGRVHVELFSQRYGSVQQDFSHLTQSIGQFGDMILQQSSRGFFDLAVASPGIGACSLKERKCVAAERNRTGGNQFRTKKITQHPLDNIILLKLSAVDNSPITSSGPFRVDKFCLSRKESRYDIG